MKSLVFWFDPISPYAYLAFERLPQVLEGVSYEVEYRPILFAGLLKHWGQKGPAEIEPKRAWTFRHVHWLARQHGIALETPAEHPFNPLAVLRLLYAAAPVDGWPNRFQCETALRHVWQGGQEANDPDRLALLGTAIAAPVDRDDPAVKQRLRKTTEAALAAGVFGVPTTEVDGRSFWGLDGLDLLAAYLRGDPWFETHWNDAGKPRPGVLRNP